MRISDFGNLRKALDTFDRNGRYSSRGHWSIARGGYDLWFEIYYDNYPVVDCVAGELERCNSDELSDPDYIRVCELIHEVYPDIPMPKLWAYRITYLGSGNEVYEPGEVIDSDENGEIYYSQDEAFSAALDEIKYSGYLTREECDIDTFEVGEI